MLPLKDGGPTVTLKPLEVPENSGSIFGLVRSVLCLHKLDLESMEGRAGKEDN